MALSRLAMEDPSFRVSSDPDSGQTIISGMGELHLEIIVDRLRREFKVDANVGDPQVAYRETITKPCDIEYTHKKQSGGAGQFAKVKIKFEPMEGYTGFEFNNTVVGGNVPKEYIPGVEKGLRSAMDAGVLAGYPVTGVKATLYDGAYHEVDSNVMCFEIAARAAFREGMRQANARLLEPIMKVEVVTPEEYMGDIIGDLNSRRGWSAVWISAAMPVWLMPAFLWPTCSVMSTPCVHFLKAVLSSRWSLIIMLKYRGRLPKPLKQKTHKSSNGILRAKSGTQILTYVYVRSGFPFRVSLLLSSLSDLCILIIINFHFGVNLNGKREI